MSEEDTKLDGPDLARGIALSTVADGAMLLGHAHGEPVLLTRRGDELFAIGNVCTHYGAPLTEGFLVDDTVRWPGHHAGRMMPDTAPISTSLLIRSRSGNVIDDGEPIQD